MTSSKKQNEERNILWHITMLTHSTPNHSQYNYVQTHTHTHTHSHTHSSGAVWESRWPSWAVRPNEPSGFRGRKELLNHTSALVSACPWYVNWHLRTLSITSSLTHTHIRHDTHKHMHTHTQHTSTCIAVFVTVLSQKYLKLTQDHFRAMLGWSFIVGPSSSFLVLYIHGGEMAY